MPSTSQPGLSQRRIGDCSRRVHEYAVKASDSTLCNTGTEANEASRMITRRRAITGKTICMTFRNPFPLVTRLSFS